MVQSVHWVWVPAIPPFAPSASISARVEELSRRSEYRLPSAVPATYGAVKSTLPPPSPELAGPPPGQGLSSAEGWRGPAYQTAGDFTAVISAQQKSLLIYRPGSKPGDKPTHTFPASSGGQLTLSDGSTLSEDPEGTLHLVSGCDHLRVTGLGTGKPELSAIAPDGLTWRSEQVSQWTGTDYRALTLASRRSEEVTFNLFVRASGASLFANALYDAKRAIPAQELDAGVAYQPDPKMLAPLGSPAWRSALQEMAGRELGNEAGCRALAELGEICRLQIQTLFHLSQANPLALFTSVRPNR